MRTVILLVSFADLARQTGLDLSSYADPIANFHG